VALTDGQFAGTEEYFTSRPSKRPQLALSSIASTGDFRGEIELSLVRNTNLRDRTVTRVSCGPALSVFFLGGPAKTHTWCRRSAISRSDFGPFTINGRPDDCFGQRNELLGFERSETFKKPERVFIAWEVAGYQKKRPHEATMAVRVNGHSTHAR